MNNRQKLVQQQFLNNEKEVLKRLKQNYGEALKNVNKKIAKLQLDIDGLNDAWAEFEGTAEEKEVLLSRIQSKIYQKKYQQAIQWQIDDVLKDLQNNAYESISEYLEKSYEDGFVGTMFDLQGQGIPLVMPLDEQAMVRAVQLDSKISNGLYSSVGEDVAELKKRITMEVSRGLASGYTYSQVARCIKGHMVGAYTKKTGGALYRAEVIARTEGHRIQVQATMDACYSAKDKGADVVKQWDSTLDSSTRESHVKVDGEIRELDEKFSNNLMFPGDPSGGAKEVVNCRCALLQRARWALGDGFTKYDNFSREHKQFENAETYNEFKKAYFSKENKDFMKYVEELEDQYGTKDFKKLLSALDDDEYKRFVQLQDARPVFSGMYRGNSVVKTKKILENSVNSDIIKLQADINKMITPYERKVLDAVPKKEGFFDFAAHGLTNAIEYGSEDMMLSAREVAKVIKHDKNYKGQKVRLLSCNTGSTDDGFAQQLANALGVEVEAPSDILFVYPNGTFKIGYDGSGKMRTFKPGGKG